VLGAFRKRNWVGRRVARSSDADQRHDVRYVPTNASAQRSVFVIAHEESPATGYRATANAVHVRNGSRSYTIIVVPQKPDANSHNDEARLAHLMSFGTAVAQNR
jgi:hypothetical protein